MSKNNNEKLTSIKNLLKIISKFSNTEGISPAYINDLGKGLINLLDNINSEHIEEYDWEICFSEEFSEEYEIYQSAKKLFK